MNRYALLGFVVFLGATGSFAQAPGTPGGDFADAPEKPLVEQTCTACHVAAQVTTQRHSKAEWTNLVDKMVGFGAQVPDDKYDLIVNYLATHYPEPPAKP